MTTNSSLPGFGIRIDIVIDWKPYSSWLTNKVPLSWGLEREAVAFPSLEAAEQFAGAS